MTNSAESVRLPISATGNVVSVAVTGEIEENAGAAAEGEETHGEEDVAIEISTVEGVVEEVGEDSIDEDHRVLDPLAEEIRESEGRFGSLPGLPLIHTCQLDVPVDAMIAAGRQHLSLGLHLLPDPNQYHAHHPADVPVLYPDPDRLLEGDQGHPKEEAIIVVVEEEVGEAETAESVADHQL